MTDLKVTKSYTLPPTQPVWVQEQAAILTQQAGKFVSASEILTRLIAEAQRNETLMARIKREIMSETQPA